MALPAFAWKMKRCSMFRNAIRTLLITNVIIFLVSPCAVLGAKHVYDYCRKATCTNKAVYGSMYCSEHVCRMDGCTEIGGYNGYCSKHKTWSSRKDKKPDSSTNKCMINGCTISRSRGYDYCLYHTCNKSGCHKQKMSGSVYCREHSK